VKLFCGYLVVWLVMFYLLLDDISLNMQGLRYQFGVLDCLGS
jgi:hypothetical protein